MFLKRLRNKLNSLSNIIQITQITIRRRRYEELRDEKRKLSPKILGGFGYKVFSQSDEDGIISEIFRRIGIKNKIFVEFGVGDGLENNSLSLLYDDWSGLWIEGSKDLCGKIQNGFSSVISTSQLQLINSFVTQIILIT